MLTKDDTSVSGPHFGGSKIDEDSETDEEHQHQEKQHGILRKIFTAEELIIVAKARVVDHLLDKD